MLSFVLTFLVTKHSWSHWNTCSCENQFAFILCISTNCSRSRCQGINFVQFGRGPQLVLSTRVSVCYSTSASWRDLQFSSEQCTSGKIGGSPAWSTSCNLSQGMHYSLGTTEPGNGYKGLWEVIAMLVLNIIIILLARKTQKIMIWYIIHRTRAEDILVLGFGYSFVESKMEGNHIFHCP